MVVDPFGSDLDKGTAFGDDWPSPKIAVFLGLMYFREAIENCSLVFLLKGSSEISLFWI